MKRVAVCTCPSDDSVESPPEYWSIRAPLEQMADVKLNQRARGRVANQTVMCALLPPHPARAVRSLLPAILVGLRVVRSLLPATRVGQVSQGSTTASGDNTAV